VLILGSAALLLLFSRRFGLNVAGGGAGATPALRRPRPSITTRRPGSVTTTLTVSVRADEKAATGSSTRSRVLEEFKEYVPRSVPPAYTLTLPQPLQVSASS